MGVITIDDLSLPSSITCNFLYPFTDFSTVDRRQRLKDAFADLNSNDIDTGLRLRPPWLDHKISETVMATVRQWVVSQELKDCDIMLNNIRDEGTQSLVL